MEFVTETVIDGSNGNTAEWRIADEVINTSSSSVIEMLDCKEFLRYHL